VTEADWRALGERAVRAKGWRWMPGTLALWQQDGEEPWPQRLAEQDPGPDGCRLVAVDLRDPATVGCLLALVREAYGPGAFAGYAMGKWRVWRCVLDAVDWHAAQATGGEADPSRGPVGAGECEQAALVAALEAAP
jgi:hypothetical protein